MDPSSANRGHGRLPRRAPDVLGGGSLAGALERWAADAAVDEAARARARARWMRVQAEESASFLGALLDLAERCAPVMVDVGAHRVRGTIGGLAADFVAVRTDLGGRTQDVLVRTAAIDVVRPEPGGAEVHGDRAPQLDVQLAGVLGALAAERPEVLVRTVAGATVRGQLRTAGTDVVRVGVDGDPPTPAWIAIGAVATLTIT